MSLYHIITNRFTIPIIEKHREEGREEGREETNEAWRDWIQRKEDAGEKGLPFDEPPPDRRR